MHVIIIYWVCNLKLLTVKVNNKKLSVLFLALLTVFLIFIDFLSVISENSENFVTDNSARVNFIKSLGVVPNEECIEEKEMVIPYNFNNVYSEYNLLQKSAGYDLTDYCGETATVYKYKISEFNASENVYVNLIICKGRVIGGDISSTEINGFMLPLEKQK